MQNQGLTSPTAGFVVWGWKAQFPIIRRFEEPARTLSRSDVFRRVVMTLRGLIIGIAVCLATIFVSSGWGQSQPKRSPDSTDTYVSVPIAPESAMEVSESFQKSLNAIESIAQRTAMKEIVADLDRKSYRQLLDLQLNLQLELEADVCQLLACRDVPTDVVRRYVLGYVTMRVANETYQIALRNAAAAERSTLIAAVSASVSLLSLVISLLSYRSTVRNTKTAIPA